MIYGYLRFPAKPTATDPAILRLKNAGCVKIFRDIGPFTKEGSFKQRDDAIAILQTGDTLILQKLSTFAYSLAELLDFFSAFREKGAAIISLEESFNSEIAAAPFSTAALLQELDRTIASERMSAYYSEAQRLGKKTEKRSILSSEDKIKALEMMERMNTKDVARIFKVNPATLTAYKRERDGPMRKRMTHAEKEEAKAMLKKLTVEEVAAKYPGVRLETIQKLKDQG